MLQGCKDILKQVASNGEVEILWNSISCVQFKRLKSLNFGGTVWGDSHFGSPKFYLFFTFTYLKNFMCLLKRLKTLNLGGPRLGKTLIVAPPMSVSASLFLISTHSETLIHLAIMV